MCNSDENHWTTACFEGAVAIAPPHVCQPLPSPASPLSIGHFHFAPTFSRKRLQGRAACYPISFIALVGAA